MTPRADSVAFIAATLKFVMERRKLSYLRLLNLLADEFGSDGVQRAALNAYTALVKSGAIVSSTPLFQGEPAIGPDTEVSVCAALEAALLDEDHRHADHGL